jgi:FKBP-type peptidyl-prolyl cis-trans isomerase FkpA
MKSILLSLVSLLFVSCISDTEKSSNVDYTAQNEKKLSTILPQINWLRKKSSTGLYYVINNAGTGAQPTSSSNVTVAYKGSYTNGNVFDKSSDAGISFGLQQVIKGWTEGIPFQRRR